MRSSLRVLMLSLACSAALAAQAQTTTPAAVNIPAGDLSAALDVLARQSGAQFVYRPDQLKGLKTRGAQGTLTSDQALDRLLQGSGFVAKRDSSGAVLIVAQAATPAAAPPPPRPATPPPSGQSAAIADPVTQLESIQVTGSRIPRAQIEGPAPVAVITAEDIKANGFTTVPDVLRAMTQNGGETQSQQSANGADFSPGAQQVDLRGLGPNHSLVLVNGRRIADFPI